MENFEFKKLIDANSNETLASQIKNLAKLHLEECAKIEEYDIELCGDNFAVVYKTTDEYYYIIIDTYEEDYCYETDDIGIALKLATDNLYSMSI